MNRLLSIIFLTISVLCLALTVSPVVAQETSSLKDMKAFIRQNQLSDVLQAIADNHWRAPIIYSWWHVENIASDEKRMEMCEARAFGEILDNRLSEWASLVTSASNSLETQWTVDLFFRLADWLTASRGYGNLLLASRCHDIATVGVGRLVVDLDYPFEKVTELMKSLDAPWYAASVRMMVLNREAGIDLFVSRSKQEEEIQEALEEIWRSGALLVSMEQSPEIKAALEGNPPKGMEYITQLANALDVKNLDDPLIKDNIEFFKDDDLSAIPRPLTLVNLSKSKWHEKFIIGFDLQNVNNLKALVAFRAAVGHFPEGRAGFEDSWHPHATRTTYKLYAPAWRAYDAIRRGSFLDYDSGQKAK